MGFKQEMEEKAGGRIPQSRWWGFVDFVSRECQMGDVARAMREYLVTGDESGLTPKRREFVASYYDRVIRGLADGRQR